MKRVIKFRGKRLANDEWCYGSLLIWADGECIILEKSDSSNDMWKREINPDTVGQFTGLCDCNGREIYEGDVIKSMYNDIYHVIGYNENRGAFTATLINEYMDNTDGLKTECNVEQKWLCDMKKVVVGNIYDNPELLEGGEQ